MSMGCPLKDITSSVITVETPGQRPRFPTVTSSKPKLLRQTSLFAFAARSSPIASTSSSPPPPSSSSARASDEGYGSSQVQDDVESEEEGPSTPAGKRRRLYGNDREYDEMDEEEDDVPMQLDPIIQARRARALARNRGETTPRLHDLTRQAEYSQNIIQSNHVNSISGHFSSSYLDSLVSNDSQDVFRCMSQQDRRDFTPPFACSFSNASKAGGRNILAVADEEGVISLLNADKQAEHSYNAFSTSFQPHHNAVFDLRWSLDDRQIATGSGDQSVVVTDVETNKRVARMAIHTCSVKQVAFDPHNPNMLSSASRDGSIAVWDQRLPSKNGSLSPVNHIRFAHDTWAKSRKNKDTTRSSTRSVTSIVYMQHQENLLASAGSADGVIKLWDLRKNAAKRINPASVEDSIDFTSFGSEGTSRARQYGISSLCLSPDGSRLYALAVNSKIYVHDSLYISRPLEAPMHTFSAPSLLSSSFYVRLAMSPCGQYLAAGSSGNGFNTSIWDLKTHSAQQLYGETREASAVLKGNTQEVGGIDWADDALATCGDDMLVRLWRPNAEVANRCRKDANSEDRWHYSGSWDKSEAGKKIDAMECD